MTVLYSQRSLRDLERIRDYITGETASRDVANRYLARLLDACDALSVLPERYAP